MLADESGRNGLFVLAGSEQSGLSRAIGQSLVGRTALLRLLPFSLAERQRTGASDAIDDIIFTGFYPRILDHGLEPRQALGDYFETYVERDVRRLGEIRNLSGFRRFVRLCAGRVGQLVNLSSLGSDAGVSHTTAREWLTVLEASYVVFQLPPFHANTRKAPGQVPQALLLRRRPGRVPHGHPERRARWPPIPCAARCSRTWWSRRRSSTASTAAATSTSASFAIRGDWSATCLYDTGNGIHAIEIKAGATVASDYFTSLNQGRRAASRHLRQDRRIRRSHPPAPRRHPKPSLCPQLTTALERADAG